MIRIKLEAMLAKDDQKPEENKMYDFYVVNIDGQGTKIGEGYINHAGTWVLHSHKFDVMDHVYVIDGERACYTDKSNISEGSGVETNFDY